MIEIDGLRLRDRRELASHRVPEDPTQMVSLRLPVGGWRRLREIAAERGTTAGELVRVMIEDLIRRIDG